MAYGKFKTDKSGKPGKDKGKRDDDRFTIMPVKPGKPKPKPFDPRKERQLPTRVKPEGQRRKSSDMGKTANNGRIKPGTRGR